MKECVGPRPSGAHAVRQRFRGGPSRDDQIAIEQGHRLLQRQRVDHVAPERLAIGKATELGTAAAQEQGKGIAAPAQPVAPAPHGVAIAARARHAAVHRAARRPSSINKTTCCTAQPYQRRGAMHAGSCEQVRSQDRNRKRRTATGLSDSPTLRSALRS